MAERLKIRALRAEEIDCRISTINDRGLSLLLYKDARVDQTILDEMFGVFGWQRSHQMIGDRLYCTVTVRDPETGEWISKQDVGTESNTEKEKGQASDAFKRACFNLGIGRELYTAPFIWVEAGNFNVTTKNGKQTTYDKFAVTAVEVADGKITALEVKNQKTGRVVFSMGYGRRAASPPPAKPEPARASAPPTNPTPPPTPPADAPLDTKRALEMLGVVKSHKIPQEELLKLYGIKASSELKVSHYEDFRKRGQAWIAETEKIYA